MALMASVQKTSDEDMAGSAACDWRDPPFLGGAARRELNSEYIRFTSSRTFQSIMKVYIWKSKKRCI